MLKKKCNIGLYFEVLYYKLVSIIYNLAPENDMKERIYKYAVKRFPDADS